MPTNFISIHEYVREHQHKKFRYGSNDCCTFACGMIKKIGDKDPIKEMGIKYSTEKGALKTIKKLGGLQKAADDFIGEEIPLAWARLGDIVLGDFEEGETLGICMGLDSVFVTLKGIAHKPTLQLTKAWRF